MLILVDIVVLVVVNSIVQTIVKIIFFAKQTIVILVHANFL